MADDLRGSVEVELAYTLAEPNDAERFLAARRLGPFTAASGRPRPTQVEDRYVDTVDGALARAGFAARLRRSPTGTVVTVKSRGSDGGALQRRTELEGAADMSVGAASWPPSTARALVLELCGDAPLGEVVTIRQVRRKRDLAADATRAELTLDDVEVVAGGSVVARFAELEVELIAGDEQPLLELEEVLAEDRRLAPSGRSKFERALEATGLIGRGSRTGSHWIRPALDQRVRQRGGSDASSSREATLRLKETAKPVASVETSDRLPPTQPADPPRGPGVRADDTLAEAGRKVLRFHHERFLARAAGVREGSDPDELKSMRVATRRMRAAWRVFGDAFRPAKTRRARSTLRDVAGRLGAVRDLDVLLDGLDSFRRGLAPESAATLEPLASAWQADREAKRQALGLVFDDQYAELIEAYESFFEAPTDDVARGVSRAEPRLVRETAGSRIWGAAERVRAFEPLVGTADPATLHRLRIATKRLRYTIEFFREPLGADVPELIVRTVAVQDHLGQLNDADVAAGLARDFLIGHGAELSGTEIEGIGRYLAAREADIVRLREAFAGPWAGVSDAEFRRRLAGAIAQL